MIRVSVIEKHTVQRMGLREVLASDPSITVVDTISEPRLHGPNETDVILLSYCSVCDTPSVELVRGLARKHRIVLYSGKETPISLLTYRNAKVNALVHQSDPDMTLRRAIHAAASGGLDETIDAVTSLPGLSERESLVLTYVSEGYTNDQIARRIGISKHTVDTYIRRIRGKFKLGNRAQLARAAAHLAEAG